MKDFLGRYFERIALFALLIVTLYGACLEFYAIAWGTETWLGQFSFKWFILFLSFTFFCIALFFCAILFFRQNEKMMQVLNSFILLRERSGSLRWLIAVFVMIVPAWFLQYTIWGVVFQGMYIRILIWFLSILFFAVILTKGETFAGWNEFLLAFFFTTVVFSVTILLRNVHNYPFSLGWSEGNRLWDYSVMFGRSLYIYPPNREIPVLLDKGRQFVGGLPFLIPGLTIGMERLWLALMLVIPYLLVGFAAFRASDRSKFNVLLAVLWTFLFLKQGPIHTPLVLCAALTALAWRSSLWIAIPLIIFSGYFAQTSRFSWLFAPGIWIVMLEFSSASLLNGKLSMQTWIRSASLGIAGVFGGYLLPKLFELFNIYGGAAVNLEQVGDALANSGLTIADINNEVTHQPLLWYRLFPNSTFGSGILFGLLMAVGPLLIVLIYLSGRKIWKLDIWQKLSLVLPLMAFLIVGLVASTKIGGGGDLHNMDMFLIGLFFTSVVAWQNGGGEWLQRMHVMPGWLKFVIVFSLFMPALTPLSQMRSYRFGHEASRLATLTDRPRVEALEMLPTQQVIDSSLASIRNEVEQAKTRGDVLFLDQRQLLTFGYITDLELIPEYEKKLLMNEALAANAGYFQPFYQDLAAQRFSLIISEQLKTPLKDSSYQFGEENNAWVTWVSTPILCYYEPIATLKEVKVQMLVPRLEPADCVNLLP